MSSPAPWPLRAAPAAAVAALLAAASLAVHRALAFDPEAWVVWGRELWTLSIDTSAGPSWKPLGALVAALGDGSPWVWLIVARAGALLAVAGVARLAWDAAGLAAAVAAGALVALSPWWAFNGTLGNAEPLLVALCAWAAVAHAQRRPGLAFALGCAAALVRVEIWPFLAAYGLWLARGGRLPWRTVLGGGAAVLALWIVPDLLASGLRSSRGAHTAGSPESAGHAAFPFGAVLKDAVDVATVPVVFVALLGPRRWLVAGLLYVLLVAVMTEAGFAGNPRYLIPGLAALALAAAVAAGRRHPAAAAALVLAAAAFSVGDLRDQRTDLAHRARLRSALERTLDARRCPAVRGPADQRSLVAELTSESIPRAAARPANLTLTGERWTLRC